MENREEPQTVPFHSDFHRDVTLWLQDNTHLTCEERIEKVKSMMLLAKINLDIPLLFHYAAVGFTAMDLIFENGKRYEKNVNLTMKIGKSLSDRVQSEHRLKSSKNANQASRGIFTPARESLKQHWQEHIPLNKKATEAAISLEKTDIYKNANPQPKRATLEGYVRDWQKELQAVPK